MNVLRFKFGWMAAASVFALLASAHGQVQDRLTLVDPFIGTGPAGHTFPGATVPFGMVQLSPDTQIRPFKQSYKCASGYRYEFDDLGFFAHALLRIGPLRSW